MTEVIDTTTRTGVGRWHVDRSARQPIAQLLLGHGAGGGVGAADLVTLASDLPAAGIEVARFEQPWRVAGRKVAGSPKTLDEAWMDALPLIASPGLPVVVGGRSAGARVACRTARAAGATAVLTLAFPLHPPGRPEKSRANELPSLPLLAVQGSRDPFGSASDLEPHLGKDQHALEIAGADHSLRVGRSAPVTQPEVQEILILGVRRWVHQVVGALAR